MSDQVVCVPQGGQETVGSFGKADPAQGKYPCADAGIIGVSRLRVIVLIIAVFVIALLVIAAFIVLLPLVGCPAKLEWLSPPTAERCPRKQLPDVRPLDCDVEVPGIPALFSRAI